MYFDAITILNVHVNKERKENKEKKTPMVGNIISTVVS